MIEKLQKRFIKIISITVLLTMVLLCLISLFANYNSMKQSEINTLDTIVSNSYKMPKDFDRPSEDYYTTRYFTLRFNSKGKLSEANLSNITKVNNDQTNEYIEIALDNGEGYGYKDGYRFLVEKNGDDRYMATFLDVEKEMVQFKKTAFYTVLAALICSLLIIVLSVAYSKKIVYPYIENDRRQKEFITNASHELKTPITTISASLKVLQTEIGDNKWLNASIKQTNNLSSLVNELVTLSKLNEEKELLKESFNLSEAIYETSDFFTALANSRNLDIEVNCKENVMYIGNEENISRLISILLDNAIKYSDENSTIELKLLKESNYQVFSCLNKSSLINRDDLKYLFDRFYRSDKSHNKKTNGYGLGLAIAKAICERHNGHLSVDYKDGVVEFKAYLNEK